MPFCRFGRFTISLATGSRQRQQKRGSEITSKDGVGGSSQQRPAASRVSLVHAWSRCLATSTGPPAHTAPAADSYQILYQSYQ